MSEKKHKIPIILGLITARGGSKGIPGKNIAPVAGKPLIAWSIETALNSRFLDRVVVSTDDEKIAQTSLSYGAELPFIRPSDLAQDDSPHIDVIVHAVKWLIDNQNYQPEYIMLLQPTSPFRTVEDIDNAAKIAIEKNADAIVSIYPSPVHPYFMKIISESNETLVDYIEKPEGYLPRQALGDIYALNGAIYLVKSEVILSGKTWSEVKALPYIMPENRSIDIDTRWHLHLADLLLRDLHDI